jgi:hypothetical protein
MQDAILKSGWDSLLFAVPFVGMLLLVFLRLDEVIAAPKGVGRHVRPACGEDKDGETILTDPDGRLWNQPRLAGEEGQRGASQEPRRRGAQSGLACRRIRRYY